ncbi:MAG: BlaB/IND/MUS family subclass B1 metallo-beta-lactamase [Flavobacterium sp.]
MKPISKLKITLFFLLFVNTLFSQTQEPKLIITHLTGDFYIYTTYNNYKGTKVPANGMYVLTNNGAVILDSPWDETQFQPLLDSIKVKHNKNVVMCIATHSHEDRTAALTYYKGKGIKTYTTKQTDEISKKKEGNRAEFLIEKDTVFSIGNHKFQTYYGGAGHAPDNIVIWFGKEKILYGGCLIKSVEASDLGNLGDANVPEWEKTLKKLQSKFQKPNFIIPGHQRWNSTNSINHTLKLIRQYNSETKK